MRKTLFEAAHAAAGILKTHYGRVSSLAVEKKGRNDFVTFVDRAAEKAILEIVRRRHPDHAILTEERGELPGGSGWRWIIDPLDGTTNFLRRHPHFAVSIAIERQGRLEAGLVLDVMGGRAFFAQRGRGAFCGRRRMAVSTVSRMGDSLALFGTPFRDRRLVAPFIRVFAGIQAACGDHRREGSAALDLAAVADGCAEAFYETGLKPWDMAAGSLLVKEAGGWVGDFFGDNDDLARRTLLATNGRLRKAFRLFFKGTRF
jgi:myo-inositol-1(or 4)-monophosphatase